MLSPYRASNAKLRLQEERIDHILYHHNWDTEEPEVTVPAPVPHYLLNEYRKLGWNVAEGEDGNFIFIPVEDLLP